MSLDRQSILGIVAMLLFAATSAPAKAEPQAGGIASASEGTENWAYLRGLAHGIEWTVSQGRFEKHPPFCAPPNLAVTTDQYQQILARQIQLRPEQATQLAGIVLLDGLKRTFPCAKN